MGSLNVPLVMFGTFSVIRSSQFVALLLAVGFIASVGCQCLSPKPSTTPISPPPVAPQILPPKIGEPDPYTAFRPITLMPEQFTPPLLTQEPPKIEPSPEIISAPSNAAQSTIDELNRRITELEVQLEEAQSAVAQQPLPPPKIVDNLLSSDLLSVEMPGGRTARSLPIINKQGVNVYADESQHARVEVPDKALFMPNAWQLTTEGEEVLRVIAAELRAFDSKSVLDIEGHTDSLMGDPSNPMQKHEISSVKTKAVMDFFVNVLNWDTSRICTSSFGRSRPIADNGTPEGRAKNNRIEIVVRSESE